MLQYLAIHATLIVANLLSLAELKKMSSDPTYNINVSGEIKQMLQELGTEKAKEIAMLGGGGNKARNERAAAIAAILAARSKVKEDSKTDSNGEPKPKQVFSVVDAASASVHGRSAAAAKAASSDKAAARIAMHMAGERAPVNAKMVSFSCPRLFCMEFKKHWAFAEPQMLCGVCLVSVYDWTELILY